MLNLSKSVKCQFLSLTKKYETTKRMKNFHTISFLMKSGATFWHETTVYLTTKLTTFEDIHYFIITQQRCDKFILFWRSVINSSCSDNVFFKRHKKPFYWNKHNDDFIQLLIASGALSSKYTIYFAIFA